MAANLAAVGVNPDRILDADPTWFVFTQAWIDVLIQRQEKAVKG
jgi:hypothetical protein